MTQVFSFVAGVAVGAILVQAARVLFANREVWRKPPGPKRRH